MAAEFEITDIDDSGGFITEHVSGADVFWHSHPEYEIMLNIDSAGTRIVGDSAEMFGSYDLVLIGDNLPHSWEYYATATILAGKGCDDPFQTFINR